MTENLYLILHKVRGEPAFDIAQRICSGPAPCQPNCGHWNGEVCKADEENLWIIPTSGHRAYPYASASLEDLCFIYEGGTISAFKDMLATPAPESVRDHYAASEPRAAPAVKRVSVPSTQTEDFIV